MIDDDKVYITLYCRECDNEFCVTESKYPRKNDGCTRQVPQSIADEYYYRTDEQYPLMLKNDRFSAEDKARAASELIQWEHDNIYSAPLGKIIGHRSSKFSLLV